MFIQLHTYAFVSLFSALVSLIASIATWRRSAPGSFALSLLLLAMSIWSGCYATRWMNISTEVQIFYFRMMYIGIVSIPTLFLVFAIAFTRNESWLTPRNLLLLSIEPILSLLLQWTNSYHHLLYRSMNVVQENGYIVIEMTRGPWYVANMVYSYVVIAFGIFLMSQGALRSGPLYRYQYRLVLFAALIPWAGNIFNELNFSKSNHLDLAPLSFGISGIIFAFSVLRTHLMHLIPVARSHLIETMHDGVLVLDAQNRIVDINPAMENFLEGKLSSYMGKNASDVFTEWMGNTDFLWDEIETRAELRVPQNPPRYLDLRVTPLYDRSHLLNGRLLVFRDVTERKQAEKKLRYANERLQSQLIEIGMLQSKLREQAIRDPLTNLFNRRYLEETLDRELARAAREEYPLSIIMMDLDHFKKTNDMYGHEAGDHVLRALANTLSELSRRGDFACRYGGEEFVLVMINLDQHTAYERAKDLRTWLSSLEMTYEGNNLSITISMGIASFPGNGKTREAILRAADKALYAAKEAGRDHILAYDQLPISEELPEG